ncbi:MAG: alpha-E domain-containing protein [Actinomycetota bacterium]
MSTVSAHEIASAYEIAMALERADASARVLGARALAARHGPGPAAAFSALAAAGPEGLVPPVGTGGALAARHLQHAALVAASAGEALPADVGDALAHAATAARAQAGGANALDPRGAAIAVRREVAAVRGLAADAMPRDARWHAMRLGTFLPRAGWMSALLMACADVAHADPAAADGVWQAAALVAGADGMPGAEHVMLTLLADGDHPVSVAHAVDRVTGALFALSRGGGADAGPLALARATAARISTAGSGNLTVPTDAAVVGEVLDAIGAIAGSIRLGGGGGDAARGARGASRVRGAQAQQPMAA